MSDEKWIDFYKELQVDHNCTDDELKKSYFALVREYHPDRRPNDAEANAKTQVHQQMFQS